MWTTSSCPVLDRGRRGEGRGKRDLPFNVGNVDEVVLEGREAGRGGEFGESHVYERRVSTRSFVITSRKTRTHLLVMCEEGRRRERGCDFFSLGALALPGARVSHNTRAYTLVSRSLTHPLSSSMPTRHDRLDLVPGHSLGPFQLGQPANRPFSNSFHPFPPRVLLINPLNRESLVQRPEPRQELHASVPARRHRLGRSSKERPSSSRGPTNVGVAR